jgi:hypothetical protein
LAGIFVLLRVIYTALYVADQATLRSVVWSLGCESAPERDPGQNSSKSLKSSAKNTRSGGPDRADRDPTRAKSPSMYQGVEAYPRWGPASVLIHKQGAEVIELAVTQ